MMKLKLLFGAALAIILSGCATSGVGENAGVSSPAAVDNRLSDCTLPSVNERGPIRRPLYVVGSFPDGQWIHMENRRMSYKGEGIYQVVSKEKAGNVSLQFASMSWNPQYTVAGLKMAAGVEAELKRGGFAKDTVATLPEEGTYVWSIQFAPDKKPLKAMVAQCQP